MLARKSLLMVATNLIGGVAGAIALFAVARYMTPGALGMLGFALSVVAIPGYLAILGLDPAHVKRVSQGHDLAACMGTYLRLRSVLILAYATTLAASILAWHHWQGFHDATTPAVLFVALGYQVLVNLRSMGTVTFEALVQTARAQVALLAEHLVRLPAIVLVALVFGAANGRWVPAVSWVRRLVDALGLGPLADSDGALLLAGAWTLAILASAAAALSMLRWYRIPVGRLDASTVRSYIRFAAPVALVSLVAGLPGHLDKLMLGYFWDADEVGHYFAAQRLASLALMVPTALGTIFFPLLSQLAERAPEAMREVAASTLRLSSLGMVALILPIVVFSEEAIHIALSDAYLDGEASLRFLALHVFVVGLLVVPRTIILARDRPRLAARVGLFAVAANGILNLAFIPGSLLGVPLLGLGATGAALATLVAAAATGIVMFAAARRAAGSSGLSGAIAWHLGAATAAGLVADTVLQAGLWPAVDRFYGLAFAAAATVALYLFLLFLVRQVGRKEWRLVLDLLHPGKLAAYVRQELRR